LRGGPDKGCFSQSSSLHVGIGTVLKEQLNGVRTPCPGCGHQRGFAFQERCIWIGIGFEQSSDHGGAPVGRSNPERCDTVAIRGVDVCAGRQQCPDGGDVVGSGRPVQGRRAVSLASVYIDMLPKQRVHSSLITVFDGLKQTFSAGRIRNRSGQERNERRSTEASHGYSSRGPVLSPTLSMELPNV